MNAENRALGSCYCGSVKFMIDLPVKGCVHCHCLNCRRAHGAALVTWVAVTIESFKVAGRENLKWFQSSLHSRRGFCTHCGTHLLYMSTHFPGDVHVTRASLVGDVDIPIKAHLHFDQHVDWFPFDDDLPRLKDMGFSGS